MADADDLELLAQLGVSVETKAAPAHTAREERIIAGFEDIVRFFEEHGRADHPPRWRSPWRESFRAAVERVRRTDPEQWPQQPRHKRRHITEAQKSRIEKLCALRDRKAEALGLEASLLGSRSTLEEVVLETGGPSEAILMPWQKEVLEIESGSAASSV